MGLQYVSMLSQGTLNWPIPSGWRCQLNRSMQHHPTHWFDNACPEEPIWLTALGENLASRGSVPVDLTERAFLAFAFNARWFELSVASTHW